MSQRLVSYAVVAIAALTVGWGFIEHQRQIGARDVLLRQERALTDSLRKRGVRLDTVYLADTVTLTRTETRRVVLRDTLLLNVRDTLLVKEYIAVSDSTVRACTAALRTCEQRVSVERQRRESAERQIDLLKKQQPGLLSRCGVYAGYGVGQSFNGPVIAAGCRLWP